jgi:hypothetical protein
MSRPPVPDGHEGDEARMYEVGRLIQHRELGLGRILLMEGPKATVYFRDLAGARPEDAIRKINTTVVPLSDAPSQSDPILDNLPPYANGRFQRTTRRRVTLDEGIELFRSHCPLFFEDPAYIGDLKKGERTYKWAAHELFERELGGGRLEQLLREDRLDEVRKHALAVEGRLNVVNRFEKSAFRDALKDDYAAARYFEALAQLLATTEVERESFESYLGSVASLPSEEGRTSPIKWTVATILPFLAKPTQFMFLKPEVTQDCAARLMFDIQYAPEPNWTTYAKVLQMSEYLLDVLQQYGARDFIDVQSFIWLIGKGWKD